MQKTILNEIEIDALKELMNVAYGSATAVVANMLNAFASLSIPNIKIIETSRLINELNKLKSDSYFFSTQAFLGEFSGESAFFIDEISANNLAKHLELQTQEDLDDAILELTNILTSSLTIKLAQQLNTKVSFALPSITKKELNDIVADKTFIQYSQAIVIETELNFKDQMIHGKIFILTKDESIQWLKNQIDIILQELL